MRRFSPPRGPGKGFGRCTGSREAGVSGTARFGFPKPTEFHFQQPAWPAASARAGVSRPRGKPSGPGGVAAARSPCPPHGCKPPAIFSWEKEARRPPAHVLGLWQSHASSPICLRRHLWEGFG